MTTTCYRCFLSTAVRLLLLYNVVLVRANMNAGPYEIANSETYEAAYDENTEFFDVYSPLIQTRYSEVYWKMQEDVPLPESIQKRFRNKTMAIIGYEVDQVQRTSKGVDTSVPITWAYNHHYCAYLSNAEKVVLTKSKPTKEAARGGLNHGGMEYWKPEMLFHQEEEEETSEIPLVHFFSEGNGGEFRKSWHGYPKGYAQLLDSPNMFHIQPMQIDTWNRDTMKSPKYMPGGPLPGNSHIPPEAGYSGLIECPCSDRLPKHWAMTYALDDDDKSDSSCTAPIHNASECFAAARLVAQARSYTESTNNTRSKPAGCSVEPHADGSVNMVWNNNSDSAAVTDHAQRQEEVSQLVAFSQAEVNVTLAMSTTEAQNAVTMTLVGPADRWFGIGFGSINMCIHMEADQCTDGGPYAIVVMGEDVVERKLDFHGPGRVLPSSVTVQSNTVSAHGNRTVVLVRSLQGASAAHYTFDPSGDTNIPIITARGCDLVFAQHCGHGPSELNLLSVGEPAGICQAGIEGTIGGNVFRDKGRCAPFPTGTLDQQHNPTCSIQTYRGGLACCRHGQSLLDGDQQVPWGDQFLEYHLKFRFYFEEYHAGDDSVAPSHQSLIRLYWTTEAFAGEYDIVKCPQGTPPSQCVQVITSRWKVRDMMHDCSIRQDASWCTGKGSTDSDKTEGIQLIYAGPHCHAPTCLSMELYNADTGQLLCHMEPIHGETDELYDEHGFLSIPPCLWGNDDDGLTHPVLLSLDNNLLSIKRNNNTLGHTGEMASWQMRGVVVPKRDPTRTTQVEELVSDERRDQKLRGG